MGSKWINRIWFFQDMKKELGFAGYEKIQVVNVYKEEEGIKKKTECEDKERDGDMGR